MSDSFGKRLDNLITQFIKDKNRLLKGTRKTPENSSLKLNVS